MKDFQEAAQRVRQELQERLDTLRIYIRSENFDRDLDRLALRLKLDTEEYRQLPKEGKAKYLFEHARNQVLRAAETGGVFALLSRRSQVVLAISLICGGIKGGEILFECYHVFAPAVRRRGLHAV